MQIQSLLSNRHNVVKIENVYSEKFKLKVEVPQGSNLSPLLYLIYTNKMYGILKYSETFGYADDLALAIQHWNLKQAIKLLQGIQTN